MLLFLLQQHINGDAHKMDLFPVVGTLSLLSYPGETNDLGFLLPTFRKNHAVIGLQALCSNTAFIPYTCHGKYGSQTHILLFASRREMAKLHCIMGMIENTQVFCSIVPIFFATHMFL